MREKTKKKGAKTKSRQKKSYTCRQCHKQFDNASNWHSHVKLHSTELPYQCELCDYKCKIKKYLSRHVKKTHTKPTGHQCTECGKCFHYSCSLKNHMRVHTGEKPHKCEFCDKAFSSLYSLNGHKFIHTGEKPFQCQYCDYACRDSSTIRRHMERHLGVTKNYPCSICNKNFKKKESLRIHVDEIHFELDTRKHPCEHCDKAFKTVGSRNCHVNAVHKQNNRVKCEICGLICTKHNLQAHMRRHIDVRPYKCSYRPCGKRFKDKGDLKRHQVIHYPENHHVCTVCNRRFPRKFRLAKHILNGCRRAQCHDCGQLFSDKRFLARHIKNAHGPYPRSREYLCDICDLVTYSRRGIIQHLKYGHGTEKDTKCQICKKDYFKYLTLKDHYLSNHNLIYRLLEKKKKGVVKIKREPSEEIEDMGNSSDFIYEVGIQKQEVDDPPLLTLQPTSPQHLDVDADTITYSKKVLSEDISRSLIERDSVSNANDDFFIGNVLKKPEVFDLPKQIVDLQKKKRVDKSLEKLLSTVRIRKQCVVLEKLRRQYNRRIKMATSCGNKPEPKQSIRFFKKPDNNNETAKLQNDSDADIEINRNGDEINDEEIDDVNKDKTDLETKEKANGNDEKNDDADKAIGDADKAIDDADEASGDADESIGDADKAIGDADKAIDDADEAIDGADKTIDDADEAIDDADESIDDEKDSDYKDSEFESNSDEETNPNGKLKFNTHQCYVCFKLFKTKTELKRHCKHHFDICTEKMLKKCPFCGYVTNSTITRHIKLVHKVSLDIRYGRIKERDTKNGSKYVFEIDKDCDLEIIPSISNLNKIASMKIDEKNRTSKNVFLGTTKLVKKGGDWMVQKQKVDVNNQYLLPEFAKDDYLDLKSIGDSYLEQIRCLSIVAKKKGIKILYPCEGCDKICLTLSALKLHNRKHELNPKRFKPKVWKNKILKGIGGRYSHVNKNNNNKKKYGNNNKNGSVSNDKGGRSNNNINKKSRKLEKNCTNKREASEAVANRFADPNPVRNKHKCDKKLIEFYKNNIKGGDIEFWQFLKIFNKMGRENVNDFSDLENRYDFGMHKIVNNEVGASEDTTVSNKEDIVDTAQVMPKKTTGIKKKAFTRAIMISKKEYLKRLEIKNQMRQRISRSES